MVDRNGRYFFALWPPAAVRERLASLAAECRDKVGGRAVRSEKLHLTVAFLGPLSEPERAAVLGCATSIELPGFDLSVDRVGYWRRSGIVWAGCRHVPAPLAGFVAALTGSLRRHGFGLDDRPYQPHVTLLRHARQRPRLAVPNISWPIAGFCLVNSELSEPGAPYQRIENWPAQTGPDVK